MRDGHKRFHSFLGKALQGLVLWAALLALTSPQVIQRFGRLLEWLDRSSELLWATQRSLVIFAAAAFGVIAITGTAVLGAPPYWRALRRWFNNPDRLQGHVLPVTLAFLSATSLAVGGSRPQCWISLLVLILSTLVLGARLVGILRLSRIDCPEPEVSTFDEIWGESGDASSLTEDQDELERVPLTEEFERLITDRSGTSLSLGLEGALGSGKTTILKWIESRLRSKGYEVVWFQAWDYREPDRLIEEYFRRLGEALRTEGILTGGHRELRRLASGLVKLPGGRAREVLEAVVGDRLSETTERAREDLRASLDLLPRPIIVLVDDLDRLDGQELRAILQAFRLLSNLPKLTHVFAYDREQLAKTLFPEDSGGTRARDYLAKIIQTEFALGAPPEDVAVRLLYYTLSPLLDPLDVSAQERFRERLQGALLRALREALPTPREIRRVAAATAWIWQRMKRHVNLLDLFLVCTIQYRFPHLYSVLRAHHEWFTEVKWGERLDYFSQTDVLERERQQFFDDLQQRAVNSRDDQLAFQLLTALLPGLTQGESPGDRLPPYDLALTERRLLHPACFDRYFNLYVSATSITEAEMEDFRSELRPMPPGRERQEFIGQRIREEISRERLTSFSFRWDWIFGHKEWRQELDPALTSDLALAIASVSPDLAGAQERPVSATPWVGKIAYLLSLQRTDDEATRLAVEVVQRAEMLSFSGYLTSWAQEEQRAGRWFGDRRPDRDVLLDEFVRKAHERFAGKNGLPFLDQPYEDRTAVLRLTSNREEVGQWMLRDVRDDPDRLPRLLEMFQGTTVSAEGASVGPGELRELSEWVDAEKIEKLTAERPPTRWSDALERERVISFRTWLRQRKEASGS